MANTQGWVDYWTENMKDLGLTVPLSLFNAQQQIVSAIGTIVTTVKLFGPRVTVAELIGAGELTEAFAFLGSLGAAYTAGAMVGSAAVATQRCAMGGTTIAEVMDYAIRNNFGIPAVLKVLTQNPQIYDRSHGARPFYVMYPKVR